MDHMARGVGMRVVFNQQVVKLRTYSLGGRHAVWLSLNTFAANCWPAATSAVLFYCLVVTSLRCRLSLYGSSMYRGSGSSYHEAGDSLWAWTPAWTQKLIKPLPIHKRVKCMYVFIKT